MASRTKNGRNKAKKALRTKAEILKILREELPYLEREYRVSRLALFGSYARGQQNNESDIDILVEFKVPVGFVKFMNLEFYLKKVLDVRVDLVTTDALKPIMRPQILAEASYA